MPDEKGIEAIYKIHTQKQPVSENVQIDEIVKMMKDNDFNGSDVAEMITNGYFNALARLGMNAKMDARTFGYTDLKQILISREDLIKAIGKIALQKSAR